VEPVTRVNVYYAATASEPEGVCALNVEITEVFPDDPNLQRAAVEGAKANGEYHWGGGAQPHVIVRLVGGG
jgi:hypothetical protein